MPGAASLINRKPLFIASDRALFARDQVPGRTASCRAPHVIAEKCLYWPARSQAQIVEGPGLIRARDGIAAEKARLQDAGERPRHATIGSKTVAGLAEV